MVGNSFQAYQRIKEYHSGFCVTLLVGKTLDMLCAEGNLQPVCLCFFLDGLSRTFAVIGLKGFQRIQITCNADIQHLVQMFHSNLREIHLLFQQ